MMSNLPFSDNLLEQTKGFMEWLQQNRQSNVMNHPKLKFLKTFLQSFGARLPSRSEEGDDDVRKWFNKESICVPEPASKQSNLELEMTKAIEPDNEVTQPMRPAYDLQPADKANDLRKDDEYNPEEQAHEMLREVIPIDTDSQKGTENMTRSCEIETPRVTSQEVEGGKRRCDEYNLRKIIVPNVSGSTSPTKRKSAGRKQTSKKLATSVALEVAMGSPKPTIACGMCGNRFDSILKCTHHGDETHSKTRDDNSNVQEDAGLETTEDNDHNQLTKERPNSRSQLQCYICDKSFAKEGVKDYLEHLFQHLNLNSYHCDVCDGTFFSQTAFNAHPSVMHLSD